MENLSIPRLTFCLHVGHTFIRNIQFATGHPELLGYVLEPVLYCRDTSEVFSDVLFGNCPNWNLLAVTVGYGDTEFFFCPKDSKCVMS